MGRRVRNADTFARVNGQRFHTVNFPQFRGASKLQLARFNWFGISAFFQLLKRR